MENSERDPLLRSIVDGNGRNLPNVPDTESTCEIRTYKSRFWILFIFSLVCCLQCVEWNTWGPVSQSVDAAFPGWDSSTVAMMGNWGTIMFVIFIFPMCYLVQSKGLRAGVLTCVFLMAIGTVLRCFTLETPAFTILCHICAILVGIAGTLVMAAPPLIASEWFPPKERTTAVAFCQAMNQLGSVVSYLQPLIVEAPGPGVSVENIRQDIRRLMFYAAGLSTFLLLSILIKFPSRPPHPPSISSSTLKFEFGVAMTTMLRKKKFLLIVVSYSVFVGIPSAWMSVLNFSFLAFGIQQSEAMWVAIGSLLSSCAAALLVGRFTDKFYGHVKTSLVFLVLVSSISFLWFLLLTINIITPTKWQIYTSVLIGISANYATVPLFFELAVEVAYPSPEATVGGVMTSGNNLMGILFLMLFFIPSQGYTWVTICLVGGSIFSLLPLLAVREEYSRSSLDRTDSFNHSSLPYSPLTVPSTSYDSLGSRSGARRSSPGKLHHI